MKDKVFIWSPANDGSAINSQDIEMGRLLLESKGYQPYIDSSALKKFEMGITSRESRLNVLKNLSKSKEKIVLMSIYGGYTANLILDDLSILEKQTNILLTGKSDLTCILNAIFEKYSIISIYGIDFSKICNPFLSDLDKKIIFDALCLKKIMLSKPFQFNDGFWYLQPPANFPNKNWEIFGTINEDRILGVSIGGNMESLLTLSGTEYMPNFKDRVVILETISNISVGQFIMQLKSMFLSTNLNEAKVIVLGSFAPNSKLNERENIERILYSEIGNVHPTVISNVDLSHTEPSYPFYIGGIMELDIFKNEIIISIEKREI